MKTTRTQRTVSSFALPSRMTLRPEGLENLRIQMLEFPFLDELDKFRNDLKDALEEKERRSLPMRRLSNLLLASFPSLAHGFEWYGGKDSNFPGYHALCVSTSNAPFQAPSVKLILSAVQVWLVDWLRPLYTKGPQIAKLCDDLLDLIVLPADWNWRNFSAQDLIEHVDRYAPL